MTRRGLLLVGTAIVLTGLNLRTAVNSVGPVLQEVQAGLGVSSGLAGLVTSLPVLCFAAIGFAGPPLAARYRDGHVLAGALLAMAAGLVLRAVAGAFWLFVAGTVLAMVGGALGNVLLPGLVKRWFPERTGLLVGAYSSALTAGGTVAAVTAAPVAGAIGQDGWRWALGMWAVLALVAALPWLAVPVRPGAGAAARPAVRTSSLVHSPLALVFACFFGLQALQAFVLVGWLPSYLRDAGLSAAAAGVLLGVNQLLVIPVHAVVPSLTVRPHLQRPLLLSFLGCYTVGWVGLWVAPTTVPWLWMAFLAVGLGTFAMVLALLGLRARTPQSTAALATAVQGWGYVLAGAGPLLVGVLLGWTGSYAPMFVLLLAGLAGMLVTGWQVTRERFVDDELAGPVREPDAASRRG
ncbi:MFS transporter, CP family, cyanate transporter [Geodermatophilus pulveris]|uniref:MFS transporter, CP family, cyanate transporter n=1 Tax=Geodermatophilus pulveris TaxID=1564159 RepID=A0A239I0S7_9ACTN|nr:MFS transporter [Geodermatophilus pulveris]SNS87071.1 MFS transporter, CP family, cyanate transporter [Geodermatophilus pulveris]